MFTLILTGWFGWMTSKADDRKPTIGARSVLGIIFPNLVK